MLAESTWSTKYRSSCKRLIILGMLLDLCPINLRWFWLLCSSAFTRFGRPSTHHTFKKSEGIVSNETHNIQIFLLLLVASLNQLNVSPRLHPPAGVDGAVAIADSTPPTGWAAAGVADSCGKQLHWVILSSSPIASDFKIKSASLARSGWAHSFPA